MVPTCVWLSMLTCSMAASYPCVSIMVNPTEGILVHPPRLHIQNVLLASWEAQNYDKADTSEDGLIMANVPFVEFLKTKQTIIPPYMPPQGFAWLGVTQVSVHGCMNTKQATTPPYLLQKDSQYTKFSFYDNMNSLVLLNCLSEPIMKQSIVAKIRHPLDDIAVCILSTAKYRDGAPFCLCMCFHT